MVIKRAGPSMKESKKSTVSVLEEQQSWGRRHFIWGMTGSFTVRPDAVELEPRIH